MRKMLTKEVTFTHFHLSKMEVVEGKPQAIEMGSEKLLGNIKPEKVQKQMRQMYNDNTILVYNVSTETLTFEMEIEEFIKHANVKGESNESK
jgi:hypothetical protein